MTTECTEQSVLLTKRFFFFNIVTLSYPWGNLIQLLTMLFMCVLICIIIMTTGSLAYAYKYPLYATVMSQPFGGHRNMNKINQALCADIIGLVSARQQKWPRKKEISNTKFSLFCLLKTGQWGMCRASRFSKRTSGETMWSSWMQWFKWARSEENECGN